MWGRRPSSEGEAHLVRALDVPSQLPDHRGLSLLASVTDTESLSSQAFIGRSFTKDKGVLTFYLHTTPGSSAGKESACDAVDPTLIPGLGSSPGEWTGYPLLYSWASLVAQMVKNPPAVWETWVRSLGWEEPLEEGMATHSNILAWRIPIDRGTWWVTVHGVT